jgi:hypothetical protein
MIFGARSGFFVQAVVVAGSVCAVQTGCERTRVTPPAYLENFKAEVTATGIDVSFELTDKYHTPTIMMFGNGVVRIDDAPDSMAVDTVMRPGTAHIAPLDSSWLLYNARLFIARENFTLETRTGTPGTKKAYVCKLGVYPYSHFLRKPKRPDGNVSVALVSMDGKHVIMATQRVVWHQAAYGPASGVVDPDRFGNR